MEYIASTRAWGVEPQAAGDGGSERFSSAGCAPCTMPDYIRWFKVGRGLVDSMSDDGRGEPGPGDVREL
jgi:hypothetical protein